VELEIESQAHQHQFHRKDMMVVLIQVQIVAALEAVVLAE